MINCSADFKTQWLKFGRELKSSVTIGSTTYDEDEISSVTPAFECKLLTAAMRSLTVVLLGVDSVDKDASVSATISVKNGNAWEDLTFTGYTVYEQEYDEASDCLTVLCYDGMLQAMKPFDVTLTYPTTVAGLLGAICTACGYTNGTTTFPNSTQAVASDIYDGLGYTYRDVLTEIAQASGRTCVITGSTLYLLPAADSGFSITPADLQGMTFGDHYGPVNCIVLSRQPQEDNVYLQDDASVTANGLTEIKISNNLLVDSARSSFLTAILNELDGLEFDTGELTTYGLPWLDVCDLFTATDLDNVSHTCICLDNSCSVGKGCSGSMQTATPEESKTDYKTAGAADERSLRKTELVVDKQAGEISSKVSITDYNGNEIVSKINQSATTVDISADKINLNGAVTANNNVQILQDGTIKAVNADVSGKFTITDGSINITTNEGTADKIVLTYDGMGDVPPGIFTTAMRATGFRTATEYDPSPSVSQHYYTNVSGREGLYSNFVSTSGGYNNKLLVSAGGGASGDDYYTTLSSSMMQFRDGSTKRILELGSNSSANKYGYINLYDATSPGVKTVNISGNDGAVSLTNPNQVQTLTIRPVINSTAISLYNGTSKYSFLVWPDSNGAGRVVLGDGTSNLWRTELTNSGLTFRNSSDVVTAQYPATGLWTKDVGSANMVDYTTFAQETISGSGVITNATTRLLSPLIPVEPSTAYYIDTGNSSIYVYEVHTYSAARVWLGYSSFSTQTASFTTGSNVYYVQVLIRKSDNAAIKASDISTIYMRKNTGLTGHSRYSVWGADAAERFAFADWYIATINSTNIASMLNSQNTSMPVKKTIIVRIFGDSGANQTLIVNKAFDNYGAAWTVGYYSQYRFELSAGTWYLKDAYEAPSVASYWSSGKENCPFIDTATPPNASSYWPTVGMKTPGGQWTAGHLGENLYFVYTATAQIGSTNNSIRYRIDGNAANTSNIERTILTNETGALKPTHVSGGGTMSATTSYKYSGYSFTVPANKYFSVTAQAYYSAVSPSKVCISDSSSAINSGHMQVEGTVDSQNTRARITWTAYASAQTTYYVWAQGATSGTLGIGIDGFYFS